MNSIEVIDDEIVLSGVLTFNTMPRVLKSVKLYLKKRAEQSSPEGSDQIILNLSGISKSDSSGLALLSGLMREAQKAHLILKIKNVPSKLLNLAQLSGLEFVCHPRAGGDLLMDPRLRGDDKRA